MIYRVEYQEYMLSCDGGRNEDWPVWDEATPLFGDFNSLDDAVCAAEEEAEKDVIELCTNTRCGNGTIARNVYMITAYTEDDYGELAPCDYNGVETDGYSRDYNAVDALDCHPDIKRAWEKAYRSYCGFLDYEDNNYWGFAEALEEELGEDWEALPYIKRVY